MSTRSRIGIKENDGTIRSVYCHFDGYPGGVGRKLVNYYDDPDLASELIDLGDISSLGETVGHAHDFDRCPSGQTNYYGRDRHEDDVATSTHETEDDFFGAGRRSGANFFYLFDQEKGWLAFNEDYEKIDW